MKNLLFLSPRKHNLGVAQAVKSHYRWPHSPVAQSVEQVTVNHRVGGSSPSRGAIFKKKVLLSSGLGANSEK